MKMTFAASEKLFSGSGNIIAERRCILDPENAKM